MILQTAASLVARQGSEADNGGDIQAGGPAAELHTLRGENSRLRCEIDVRFVELAEMTADLEKAMDTVAELRARLTAGEQREARLAANNEALQRALDARTAPSPASPPVQPEIAVPKPSLGTVAAVRATATPRVGAALPAELMFIVKGRMSTLQLLQLHRLIAGMAGLNCRAGIFFEDTAWAATAGPVAHIRKAGHVRYYPSAPAVRQVPHVVVDADSDGINLRLLDSRHVRLGGGRFAFTSEAKPVARRDFLMTPQLIACADAWKATAPGRAVLVTGVAMPGLTQVATKPLYYTTCDDADGCNGRVIVVDDKLYNDVVDLSLVTQLAGRSLHMNKVDARSVLPDLIATGRANPALETALTKAHPVVPNWSLTPVSGQAFIRSVLEDAGARPAGDSAALDYFVRLDIQSGYKFQHLQA